MEGGAYPALRELPDGRLTYAEHPGTPELRNAVAGYLARMRGVVVEPEHEVICCAASQALTVLWHVLGTAALAGSRSRTGLALAALYRRARRS